MFINVKGTFSSRFSKYTVYLNSTWITASLFVQNGAITQDSMSHFNTINTIMADIHFAFQGSSQEQTKLLYNPKEPAKTHTGQSVLPRCLAWFWSLFHIILTASNSGPCAKSSKSNVSIGRLYFFTSTLSGTESFMRLDRDTTIAFSDANKVFVMA